MLAWRRGLGRDSAWEVALGMLGMGMQGMGMQGTGMAMGTILHFSSARLSCLGEGWGGYAVGVRDKRGKRY